MDLIPTLNEPINHHKDFRGTPMELQVEAKDANYPSNEIPP